MTLQLTEQNQKLVEIAEGMLAWARKEEDRVVSYPSVDFSSMMRTAAENLIELAKLNKVWCFNPAIEGTIDLSCTDMMQIRMYCQTKAGIKVMREFQVA